MVTDLKKILITGAKGTIGTVLIRGLQGFALSPYDLPEHDVRDLPALIEACKNVDAVIHLAWTTQKENFRNGQIDPDNAIMTENVYEACRVAKVPRVIMASSVHAHNPPGHDGKALLKPSDPPVPDSPYGADKVFMELLGREYAKQGLEVICLRFGGVNIKNVPRDHPYERAVWLSHDDCLALLEKCLKTNTVPENFALLYAVSNNPTRFHDTANQLNWKPRKHTEY